mgnify:CR=1 FL=1
MKFYAVNYDKSWKLRYTPISLKGLYKLLLIKHNSDDWYAADDILKAEKNGYRAFGDITVFTVLKEIITDEDYKGEGNDVII